MHLTHSRHPASIHLRSTHIAAAALHRFSICTNTQSRGITQHAVAHSWPDKRPGTDSVCVHMVPQAPNDSYVECVSWQPRACIYHNFLTDQECQHLLRSAAPQVGAWWLARAHGRTAAGLWTWPASLPTRRPASLHSMHTAKACPLALHGRPHRPPAPSSPYSSRRPAPRSHAQPPQTRLLSMCRCAAMLILLCCCAAPTCASLRQPAPTQTCPAFLPDAAFGGG